MYYYNLKSFISIYPKIRIRNFTKMGKVCNVADLPQGKICNERGKICNVANRPLKGRSAMLQIFRGKVCNVADLPGGRFAMLQTFRGKVCKGEGLQYNTGRSYSQDPASNNERVDTETISFHSILLHILV